MFVPHQNRGHIYILWGKDQNHLVQEEYLLKRSLRMVEKTLVKMRKSGENVAFLQYEDDRTPLNFFRASELLAMGVLSENKTKKTALGPKGTARDKALTIGTVGQYLGKAPRLPHNPPKEES